MKSKHVFRVCVVLTGLMILAFSLPPVQDMVALKTLQTQTDIDSLVSAINNLTPSIGTVNLQETLRAQMNVVAGGDYAFATRTIYLFTNGTGTVTQDLIDELRRKDVVVSVVALADNAGTKALRTLAEQTGGEYVPFKPSTTALNGSDGLREDEEDFGDAAEVTGGYLIAHFEGSLQPGTPQSHALPVDTLTESIDVAVSSTHGGSLSLVLRDPSGTALDLDNPPPDVWVQRTGTQILVEIQSPADGTWTAQVDGDSPSPYALELSGEGETMVEADHRELLTFPEAAKLQVRVENGWAVAGCQVRAEVGRPGGTTDSLILYDDGNRALHGDDRSNDGIYSAFVTQYPASGVYEIEFRVENQTGQYTTAFDDIDLPPGSPPPGPVGPAPVFQRLLRESFSVEGVPSGGGTALLPPGDLILESPSPSQVTLKWSDTSGGQARTVILRSLGTPGNYLEVAVLNPGKSNYSDSVPDGYFQVFYRLAARSLAGDSLSGNTESINPPLWGDVDRDGQMTPADVLILIGLVNGTIPPGDDSVSCPECGDWDRNGILDEQDAALMSRHLAGSD